MPKTKILIFVLTVLATLATGAQTLDFFAHGSLWYKTCALINYVLMSFGILAARQLPTTDEERRQASQPSAPPAAPPST